MTANADHRLWRFCRRIADALMAILGGLIFWVAVMMAIAAIWLFWPAGLHFTAFQVLVLVLLLLIYDAVSRR